MKDLLTYESMLFTELQDSFSSKNGMFLPISIGIPEIECKLFLILSKSIALIFVHIAIKICTHIKIAIHLHSKTIDIENLKIFQLYLYDYLVRTTNVAFLPSFLHTSPYISVKYTLPSQHIHGYDFKFSISYDQPI